MSCLVEVEHLRYAYPQDRIALAQHSDPLGRPSEEVLAILQEQGLTIEDVTWIEITFCSGNHIGIPTVRYSS